MLEEDNYDAIIVKYLRKNQDFLSLKFNNAQFTIFLLAVVESRIPFVKKLLENAMSVPKLLSQKDIYGNTALHLAVLCQAKDMVKFLLERGAVTTVKNDVSFDLPDNKRNVTNRATKQR